MSHQAADPTVPRFSIEHDSQPGETLIAGFSSFGLAGLTAVDYLVDDLDLEETGHVRIDGAPSITPFTKGTPRHPIRPATSPSWSPSSSFRRSWANCSRTPSSTGRKRTGSKR